MVIQSVKASYLVIGYLAEDPQTVSYLCENTANHRRVRIIRIKNPQIFGAAMEFLYEQAANEAFVDFQDCFVSEEDLLLVFTYEQGQALTQKLQNEYCSLEERMEIMKQILEQIILLNMPYYYACWCLRPEHIFVKRSLDISFQYEITDLVNCRVDTMKTVEACFKQLNAVVFQKELKQAVIKPMADFQAVLGQNFHSSYVELYRHFLSVRTAILELSQGDLIKPKTWPFRLGERIKKTVKPLKQIITLVILAAGLFYMLWTIDQSTKPAASVQVIDQIGPLKIKGQGM